MGGGGLLVLFVNLEYRAVKSGRSFVELLDKFYFLTVVFIVFSTRSR